MVPPVKYRARNVNICYYDMMIQTSENTYRSSDYVSLFYYVNIEDRPMVLTTLKYQTKAINKKDVACSDDTGTFKLTLWRLCIECIQESVAYFIQQVKIKELPTKIIPSQQPLKLVSKYQMKTYKNQNPV